GRLAQPIVWGEDIDAVVGVTQVEFVGHGRGDHVGHSPRQTVARNGLGNGRDPFRSLCNPAAPNLPGGETHPPTASGNCTWRPQEGWHWRRASGWAAD